MIKNFNTYVNEDYFSKLATRKDNKELRKEQGANVPKGHYLIKEFPDFNFNVTIGRPHSFLIFFGNKYVCAFDSEYEYDDENDNHIVLTGDIVERDKVGRIYSGWIGYVEKSHGEDMDYIVGIIESDEFMDALQSEIDKLPATAFKE